MSKPPKGQYELNDYAEVMETFHEWCAAKGLNFRAEMAQWARFRMSSDPETAAAVAQPKPPAPPPAAPVVELLKAAAARPGRKHGNQHTDGSFVVSEQFPGEILTTGEVRRRLELPKGFNLGQYLRKGSWVRRKYLFRYATPAEIEAALAAATVHTLSPVSSPTQGVRP